MENERPFSLTTVLEIIDQHGGIDGLARRFKEGGLPSVINSWISNSEQNKPIPGALLGRMLNSHVLETVADKTGMPITKMLGMLAETMPTVIDNMTSPNRLSGGWKDAVEAFLQEQKAGPQVGTPDTKDQVPTDQTPTASDASAN